MKTVDRVLDVIRKHDPDIEATPDSRFDDFEDFDSLDRVELIMALEEEFGIEISDEDAEACEDVPTIVQIIDAKLS